MTMTLSQLAAHLQSLLEAHGDVPVVLWDMDSSWYFSFTAANIEAQKMDDGSVRLSIGPNSYQDEMQQHPAQRPTPSQAARQG